MEETWSNVDAYFSSKLHGADPDLDYVLKANSEAGLPSIDVSPSQGKFLYLLTKLKGAKHILEIGTLGGYSSIWMARALPEDGRLITLEYSQKHADVARENIRKAGLDHKIEVLVGPALESLPTLKEKGFSSFEFIFIDADKPNNPNYLKWALMLSKPGTVIIGDNVVRDGKVVDGNSQDSSVQGSRALMDLLANEPRIEATAMQTVGSKGYDGFVFGIVKE
ncbi:O-methyltransferase [Fictibacillus sp. WQ 8-8]|uniref:O-methyltransferase n=1 Tax=unclassified Fictibacillus TaxID=2644029 RepID=UPI0007817C70|nr:MULTISPECIES: O-methyltransferase [unclassified Fictibacillus]MCQ6265093.1 O-methyltransferase [Fictibacillus sp. WQ 8-8]SFE77321.1 Predicted O-methyltransferase YrrM [Bacillus sp. OV194]